jgi:hypothetical protein
MTDQNGTRTAQLKLDSTDDRAQLDQAFVAKLRLPVGTSAARIQQDESDLTSADVDRFRVVRINGDASPPPPPPPPPLPALSTLTMQAEVTSLASGLASRAPRPRREGWSWAI